MLSLICSITNTLLSFCIDPVPEMKFLSSLLLLYKCPKSKASVLGRHSPQSCIRYFLLFCSDRWNWWISGGLISWTEITSWRWGCYGASFCTGRWGKFQSLLNRLWKCTGSLVIVYSSQIKIPQCLAWTGHIDCLEILRSVSPRPKCQKSWFLLPRNSGGVWSLSILTASLLQNGVFWLMET